MNTRYARWGVINASCARLIKSCILFDQFVVVVKLKVEEIIMLVIKFAMRGAEITWLVNDNWIMLISFLLTMVTGIAYKG
jgi:hypothetical protein